MFYNYFEERYTITEGAETTVAKTVEEMTRDEMVKLSICQAAHIRRLQTELDTIKNTMNKFLARDHGDTLQNVLEHQNETNRRW